MSYFLCRAPLDYSYILPPKKAKFYILRFTFHTATVGCNPLFMRLSGFLLKLGEKSCIIGLWKKKAKNHERKTD